MKRLAHSFAAASLLAIAACSSAPTESEASQDDALSPIVKRYGCPHPDLYKGPTPDNTAYCVAPPTVDMGPNEAAAVQQLTAVGCTAPQAYQFSCGTAFFHFSRCPLSASSTVDAWIANHQRPPIVRGPGAGKSLGHGYVVNARYPDPGNLDGNICSACVPNALLGTYYVIWNLDTDIPSLMPKPPGAGSSADPGPITQCTCMAPPTW